jgi:RNase H-like domain found in reverse transcriptase/Reverse transcriptase (RNA-dependent DNA polymerase)/Integrase zinc binding domain
MVDVLVNGIQFAKSLVDNGCLCYATVSESTAKSFDLPRIRIPTRTLDGVVEHQGRITHITYFDMDVHGHRQHRVYAYVIPKQTDEMILGNTWLKDVDGRYSARKGYLDIFTPTGRRTRCWNRADPSICAPFMKPLRVTRASARRIMETVRGGQADRRMTVMKVTLADIEKALRVKEPIDPKTKLPEQYWPWLDVFSQKLADQLPQHRPGIDHRIPLKKDAAGSEHPPPFGPLYSMNREELLVLRKTLTELLGKNFVRVSKSPAASPILLVRKPGGGIRFCVDYRGLNELTVKDRYPLPLIRETLRNMSRARWFTKLDIIAAFHKIRVAPGEEWKTAFRTRYGLFEWNVTPFGLTGAPATFQRYINGVLQEYLDDFVSAYIDDIIIYSSGSLADHRRKVGQVLRKLQEAGLQCDISKSEFEQDSVKYLGFIIRAGQGICVDPKKVEAIRSWERPRSVKDVRSFLGFANFYRTFIPYFADLATPLTDLTKKDSEFLWTDSCQDAFNELKELFINAPVLCHFEEDRETILEADSSGYATGAVLSQIQDDGTLKPCAFLSQKLSPAESNYEIHDKELLSIIRALKEWRPELKMVPKFKILTDHQNLRYFKNARHLNERQMRWSDVLSEFDFDLVFRPGRLASKPDALSRRHQDMPQDGADERLARRFHAIFKRIKVTPGRTRLEQDDQVPLDFNEPVLIFDDPDLQALWEQARKDDLTYQAISLALKNGERRLSAEMQVKTSLSECHLDERGLLCFRNRVWIPTCEPLRTRIVQQVHDSHVTGHPGRDATYAILSRRFFWPGAAKDVRRFLRNCSVCGHSTIWRDTKHGLLRPLPIPQRIWAEISVDFITDLPPTGDQGATNCMVITDRLTKGVILVAMESTTADAVANAFFTHFYMHHGLPLAIVSDRGPQFVSGFWKRVCDRLGITRRLSTAFHPQTDGSTERANQEVERILRVFTTYAQSDWSQLLPVTAAAINNRDASSTGFSPFFFTHGYHIDPIGLADAGPIQDGLRAPEEAGEAFVNRLKEASDWAQAAIAVAQDRQQDQANRTRQAAPVYKTGDKVWLNLKNVRTERSSKKLDWLHAKYKVLDVPSPHTVRLDVPTGIHPVFHVELLRPAANDPLPSQVVDDSQPPPIVVDGEPEWEIEEILAARTKRVGRGERRQVLVKWLGYAQLSWHDLELFKDCEALDAFEKPFGSIMTNDGLREQYDEGNRTTRPRRRVRTGSTRLRR